MFVKTNKLSGLGWRLSTAATVALNMFIYIYIDIDVCSWWYA